MGEEIKRGASGSEEISSWRFPEGDLWSADRETFGRRMGRWFGGGPQIDREITERFDEVGHISSRRRTSGPIDRRSSPEACTEGRRVVGTPAGVEKVSSEECMAASSLTRWGGPAAVLGGLSTTFVRGLLPPHYPPKDGE
jgi:hypothetical protein